ncbi:AraC family transcriptional regulator [Bacteroides sp.]|uniref:helix-turn-helix transcriptional regulator n=1 Tax=Bacteroides sp. TaxID=29523 RepID=UPI002A81597B|nr:AraC family transcriptional regulator [Bacteroides sp.]
MMATRLMKHDLHEMMLEWPVQNLAGESRTERNSYRIDNGYLKATFEEICTPFFSIMEHHISCEESIEMYAQADEYRAVWFCAALAGHVTCFYDPITRSEEWNKGDANLLQCDGIDSCACFPKHTPFHMMEIMLSNDYIRELAGQYPDLFGNEDIETIFCDRLYRAYRTNRPFCTGIYKALSDIKLSQLNGNMALMYVDAKIREILSLFLARRGGEECLHCSCSVGIECDKIHHAKAIIEQEYLNPPSLHQLALRVGTNECTLKRGFKTVFGTTVFGHIFDYRMEIACRYLLDSSKTIQEIGACVGYEYHAHFSTAFKRKFGLTPLEYRCSRLGAS